jgi:HSP20 family protein
VLGADVVILHRKTADGRRQTADGRRQTAASVRAVALGKRRGGKSMGGESVSMWAQAVALLEEAERRHRRFFELLSSGPRRAPVWEPPVDMFVLEGELRIVIAMPAVRPEDVSIELLPGGLLVRAESRPPVPAGPARIVRLEIPYGYMERRIELPSGRFELLAQEFKDGCMQIRLIGQWS